MLHQVEVQPTCADLQHKKTDQTHFTVVQEATKLVLQHPAEAAAAWNQLRQMHVACQGPQHQLLTAPGRLRLSLLEPSPTKQQMQQILQQQLLHQQMLL